MKIVSQKKGILIFYAFDLILVILFFIILIPFTKKNNPAEMESALINPDYVKDISSISITGFDTDGSKKGISFKKRGNIWTGSSSLSNYSFVWPCDSQTIENLIAVSSRVNKMYKVGESISSWKSFEVDEKNSICITFYDSDVSTLSSIYYGKDNPLNQRIAFRTWSKDAVYEVDDTILPYLNTDESFWCDPFIYPQCLTGYDRKTSESLLRRGQLANISPREGLTSDALIRHDFENGARIELACYHRDDAYVVIPFFTAGPASSEGEKEVLNSLNYRYTISEWTFDKLLSENK